MRSLRGAGGHGRAERGPAATAARQLPAETIAEYRDAGILRILQPSRFGGLRGRFSLFSRIVEELTYGCASAAWVYAVLAEHQWIIAQYPEEAQIVVPVRKIGQRDELQMLQ